MASSILSHRLIDADGNKYMLFKKAIILINHKSTRVIEALKNLGLKVYDAKEASANYQRDFPLWLEAAQLKTAGKPYSRGDYMKFTGRYDVLVGPPASILAKDLIEAHFEAKVILINGFQDTSLTDVVAKSANSSLTKLLNYVDPDYFGKASQFFKVASQFSKELDLATIPENRVVKIDELTSWDQLCKPLGLPVPKKPFPDMEDDTVMQHLVIERLRYLTNEASKVISLGLILLMMASSVGLATFLSSALLLSFTIKDSASFGLVVFALLSLFFGIEFGSERYPKEGAHAILSWLGTTRLYSLSSTIHDRIPLFSWLKDASNWIFGATLDRAPRTRRLLKITIPGDDKMDVQPLLPHISSPIEPRLPKSPTDIPVQRNDIAIPAPKQAQATVANVKKPYYNKNNGKFNKSNGSYNRNNSSNNNRGGYRNNNGYRKNQPNQPNRSQSNTTYTPRANLVATPANSPWANHTQRIREDDIYQFVKREAAALDFDHSKVQFHETHTMRGKKE